MLAAALLLSTLASVPPACAVATTSRPAGTGDQGVPHAFQNGGQLPLRLWWVDPNGKAVNLGTIAPGAFLSIQTFVGHAFALTDPVSRCRSIVRIDDVFSGTFVGASRYHPVALRPRWHVLVDQALDPATEPARAALATIGQMLDQADVAIPPAALARVRRTPIFLHDHAGPGGMFHPDPAWLVAHGRTVQMLNGIEISDAGVFNETSKVQPGTVLHELAHGYFGRLPAADRAEIEATYRRAIENRRYLKVKRHDGSTTDAYARVNAAEYFAELTEAYFSRNDFFPFMRSELAAYDPDGERLIAKMWR